MVEKEDLGLSLSLKFPGAVGAVDLSNSSSLHFNLPFNKVPDNWTNSFTTTSSSEAWHANSNYGGLRFEFDTRKSFLKGMGMAAAAAEGMAVSSPNSSSTVVSSMSHEQDSRKKLRLSKEQSALLEESFKDHTTLNPKQKQALANKLGLRPRQVEVWFQNRRARTKLKQTEVECELMKRCCENLTEENRRLEKELQELKAFKLSPQFHMQRTPMCPSCDHVAPSSTTKLPFNPWP